MRPAIVIFIFVLCINGFADGISAGFSKINITPEKPVELSGYANRDKLSDGVHDSLYARVTFLQNSTQKLVIISTDIIGFYGGSMDIFREELMQEFQLEPHELLLSSIHTHSAPSIILNADRGHENNIAYSKNLLGKLKDAVHQAKSTLAVVEIGIASGSSPVGVNRREVFYDEHGNPKLWIGRNPNGKVDREVQVVKFEDETKANLLFQYACHSTSLGWDNYQISGDLHGLAEQFVENHLSVVGVACGFAGASGDVDPWYRVLPGFKTNNGWIPEPILMATMLGVEIVNVYQTIETKEYENLKSVYQTLSLPGKPRNNLQNNGQVENSSINVLVGRIGNIGIVGIGAEVLSEIGMQIKAASPFEQTIIITHCNGTAGYLPPQHLYNESGYEVQSSPFASTAADILVHNVVHMLHQLED